MGPGFILLVALIALALIITGLKLDSGK